MLTSCLKFSIFGVKPVQTKNELTKNYLRQFCANAIPVLCHVKHLKGSRLS